MAKIMDWSFTLNDDPNDIQIKKGDTVDLGQGEKGVVVNTRIGKKVRRVVLRNSKTGAEYVVEGRADTKRIRSGYTGRTIAPSGRSVRRQYSARPGTLSAKPATNISSVVRAPVNRSISHPRVIKTPTTASSVPQGALHPPVSLKPASPNTFHVPSNHTTLVPQLASLQTQTNMAPQAPQPRKYLMRRPFVRSFRHPVSGKQGYKYGAMPVDLNSMTNAFYGGLNDASALNWTATGQPMRIPETTAWFKDAIDDIVGNPKTSQMQKMQSLHSLYEVHRSDIERQIRIDEKEAAKINARDERSRSQMLFGRGKGSVQYGGLTEAKSRLQGTLNELERRGVITAGDAGNVMARHAALESNMLSVGGKDNWGKMSSIINKYEGALDSSIRQEEKLKQTKARVQKKLVRWDNIAGESQITRRSDMIRYGLNLLGPGSKHDQNAIKALRRRGSAMLSSIGSGKEWELGILRSWYNDVLKPYKEEKKRRDIASKERKRRFIVNDTTLRGRDMAKDLASVINSLDIDPGETAKRLAYANRLIGERGTRGGTARLASYYKSQQKQLQKQNIAKTIEQYERSRSVEIPIGRGKTASLTSSKMRSMLPRILQGRGLLEGSKHYNAILDEFDSVPTGKGYADKVARIYKRELNNLRKYDTEYAFNAISSVRSANLLGGSRLFDPTNAIQSANERAILDMAAKKVGMNIAPQIKYWEAISEYGTNKQKYAMSNQMERLSAEISKQLTPAQMRELGKEYSFDKNPSGRVDIKSTGESSRLKKLSKGIQDEQAMRLYSLRQQRLNRWSLQKEIFRNAISPIGERGNGSIGFKRINFKEAVGALGSMVKYNPGHVLGGLASAALTAGKAIMTLGSIVGGVVALISASLIRAGIKGADTRTSLMNKYNLATPTQWKNGNTYAQFEARSFANARMLRTDAYDYQKSILDMSMAVGGARYQTGPNAGKRIVTSLEQVETMSRNLMMMARATGTNEEALQAVLTQLYQGIGKGKLDTQDIKPLLNQSAAFGDMLAREVFGLSGGRSQLFAEMDAGAGNRNGGLTAERLVTGLLNPKLNASMMDVYRRTARTWEEVGTVMKSDFKQAMSSFIGGFGVASGGSFGSGLLGFSQYMAEEATVGDKKLGEALWDALGFETLKEANVPSLLTNVINTTGKLITAFAPLVGIALTLGSALSGVAGVAGALIGWIAMPMSVMTDVLGNFIQKIQHPLEADWTDWSMNTTKKFASMGWESLASIPTTASMLYNASDTAFDTMMNVGKVLEEFNASGAKSAETAMGSELISKLEDPMSTTAEDVRDIKKSTGKITGIQIALLKQITGQAVMNRVTRVTPNIVTNIGTIKSGLEYQELEARLKSTITGAIANAY